MNISKRIIRLNNFQSFVSDLFFHICLFTFSFLLLTSCETTEPPPSNQKLTLVAEDASCTEAWLNLKLDNIYLPTEIKITQNDSTIITSNINSSDTTLFIENLLPNQTYSFKVSSIQQQVSSNKVSVTTMDTTSHNFTWETFTFGGGSSSYFNDVAIINENNIWAVGEIHTEDTDKFDSNGVWVQPYNAVHWNGEEWELKRIAGFGYPRNVVYVFRENDVWFDGSIRWDGAKYSVHMDGFPLLPNGDGWRINSMWGVSSEDFYIVGNGGNIAHYNGNSWTKIESGTELSINDIYGSVEDNIKYCVSSSREYGKESFLLKIDSNNKVTKEYLSTDRHFLGIWTKRGFPIYLSGDGTYTNKSGSWQNDLPGNIYFTSDIKGNDLNDIITCGAYGFLAHNNGVGWKTYPVMIGNSYMAVDIKSNVAAAVGFSNNQAAVVVGRR